LFFFGKKKKMGAKTIITIKKMDLGQLRSSLENTFGVEVKNINESLKRRSGRPSFAHCAKLFLAFARQRRPGTHSHQLESTLLRALPEKKGKFLVVELGAAPVAALLVPLDRVASAQADPVGDRLVLVELLGVLLLDGEGLKATHFG
jgi:hypothetical protein